MALFRFHAILVACGVLFCVGFAAYEAVQYRREPAAAELWMAVFFGAAALFLSGYLWWFVRKWLRS